MSSTSKSENLGEFGEMESAMQDCDWKRVAFNMAAEMEDLVCYYYDILQMVPTALLFFDATGQVRSVNGQMAEGYLQQSVPDVLKYNMANLPFTVFRADGGDLRIREMLEQALSQGVSRDGIMVKGQVGHRQFTATLLVKSLRNRQGNGSGVLMMLKEENVQVPVFNENQQEMVHQLGLLASGVVHEVRNPLQSIGGMVQVLQLKYPDLEEIDKYAKIIMNQINGANKLLTEALKITKTKEDLDFCRCDVRELCHDMVILAASTGRAKKVLIEEQCGENMPLLYIDAGKIQQVLINLLTNALDAVDSCGKILVTATYDFALNEARISVIDNGCGMDDDALTRYDQPFFTTKQNGTGMGLYVCKKLLHEHGGRLEVKSTKGEGSCMTIVLPELAGLGLIEQDVPSAVFPCAALVAEDQD